MYTLRMNYFPNTWNVAQIIMMTTRGYFILKPCKLITRDSANLIHSIGVIE